MRVDDFILWVWILGSPLAIGVCAWMAVDLWLDRKAMRLAGINGVTKIQNTAAIRLEIITMLKSLGLWIVGLITAYFTWFPPFNVTVTQSTITPNRALSDLDLFLIDNRMWITRLCIVTVITLMPARALWDRSDRIRAGIRLRNKRKAS